MQSSGGSRPAVDTVRHQPRKTPADDESQDNFIIFHIDIKIIIFLEAVC